MIYKLLVLMLIAHILGDFYFQTDKMASEKDNSLKGVIIHAIEYTFSVFLVMIPVINSNILILILYMSLLHFIIDILKFFLLKRKIIKKTGMLFVCDQLLHITSIFILAYIMACNNIKFSHFQIIRNICDNTNFLYSKGKDYIIIMRKGCKDLEYLSISNSFANLIKKIENQEKEQKNEKTN